MAAPKVYLDEDVHESIVAALRLRGFQALTTTEAGNRAATDEEQLEFATAKGYALLTYNVPDFARLHSEWLERTSDHGGILLARQSEGYGNLRPLLNLLSSISDRDLRGQLVYLANWK